MWVKVYVLLELPVPNSFSDSGSEFDSAYEGMDLFRVARPDLRVGMRGSLACSSISSSSL
jgi:hypothetical protein